ncbi:T9SS type A sorting domain-containing protein [candidate division WOR-3 bacterium]|nr:T9SS type A sorting domain-containing protein [candidate division WOR-3 bacterium]
MEIKNRKINIIGIIMLTLFISSVHAGSKVNDISTSKNSKDYFSERGDFPIADSAGNQRYPAVAWGDTNYIVMWDDCVESGGNIRGRRVSSSGDTLGQFIIPSTLSQQGNPAVAFDGTNYLVVWQDYRNGSDYDIYGQRVNSTGGLEGSDFPISTAPDFQCWPAIAWDGTNYLAVWGDYRSGSNWDIYGQRVNPSGGLVDTNFAISTASGNQSLPAVAWGGINYLVAWRDSRNESFDIYAQRVNPSGGLEGGNFAISTALDVQCWPAIAWDSINYLVVWQDCRSGGYENADIYGQRVNSSGDTLGQFAISTATDGQQIPAIAWDGINYLVVWHDTRNGYPDIYGQRVNPSGGLVDSDFPISTAANDQCFSAIAWNGVNYLITWQDSRSSMFDWNIYGNIDVGQTGIDEIEIENLHKSVKIQVYPNPFNTSTMIYYKLQSFEPLAVTLNIYNTSGQLLRNLIDEHQGCGNYSIYWDGKDNVGKRVISGVYLSVLTAGNCCYTKKIVILR